LEALAVEYAGNLTPSILRGLSPALADRTVRVWVRERNPDAFLGAVHSAALVHVFTNPNPRGEVPLPGGLTAKRDRNRLWLEGTITGCK